PLGISAKYWYSLNQIDTPKIASKLSIPMFFLQGTQDFQVSAEVDFEAWQALELKNAQFQLYDGLNHLFMQSDGTKSVEEYNKKSTVSPQVIADIAEFIKSN
ncbi:MAG: dienelactone hydrolase family protein, partial [Christensenellaceae bacterium]